MRTDDPFEQETLPHLVELRARARRLLGRADVADDVVQETYLRALAAKRHYRLGTNARAWLHRILGNAAWATQRCERRELRLGERLLFAGAGAPTQLPTVLLGRVERALAELPAPARGVVQLVDLEGLGYADAARELGLPIGTVMSRLHRARARLRSSLAEAAPEQHVA